MKQDFKNALETIYNKKRGTIKELTESITSEMVDKFISVGFIICGYTPTDKTWKISTLGKDFFQVNYEDKLESVEKRFSTWLSTVLATGLAMWNTNLEE